ncbi:CAP-Gly domain-containing linker protein 1 [Halotydeus destructor]|nr:CAP-Gly domain-containing linker protein 1 [Halotydeus destructor]
MSLIFGNNLYKEHSPVMSVQQRASGLSRPPSNLSRSAATSTASLASTSTASSSVPSVVSTGLKRSPSTISTSDILNHNHEDLKVDEKVFVNGSKPGTIKFLGTTAFAPGTWAGVELEDTNGKNDGSVNGVRYFQCEAESGIFVRPFRLTTEKLGDDRKDMVTPTSDKSSSDQSQQQRSEPPAKVQKSNSGTTVCGNLRVGHRVLVNASSGMKIGTLRYLGPTDFATGAWAGVELDVAVGKNDGSVAGKRYFSCQMNYGLFAPVNKVTRDTPMPSTPVPSNKQATMTGGQTSSRLSTTSSSSSLYKNYKPTTTGAASSSYGLHTARRTGLSGSQESISSITSSASVRSNRVRLGVTSLSSQKTSSKVHHHGTSATMASGAATASAAAHALQEALQEKEEHISQLLKERDIERGEVARASGRLDELEERIAFLNDENHKLVLNKEELMDELRHTTEQSGEMQNELLAQLEEERQKLEALEFRLEEEMVARMELKDELDKVLDEQQQTLANSMHTHKEDDREEEMAQLQDEILRKDEKILQLEKTLEKNKSELSNSTARLKELENLAPITEERQKRYLESIDELNIKLRRQEDSVRKLKEDIDRKDAEKRRLQDEISDLLARTGDSSGQLAKMDGELRLKNDEIDVLRGHVDKLNKDLVDSRTARNKSEDELRAVLYDKDKKIDDLVRAEKQYRVEMDKKEIDIKKLEADYEKLKKNSGSNDEQLNELVAQLKSREKEHDKLETEVIKLRGQIDEMDKQLESRSTEMEHLRDEVCEKSSLVDSLQLKEKQLKESLNSIEEELISSGKQIQLDVQRRDEEIRKLQRQLDDLLQTSGDSGAQLAVVNEELRTKKRQCDDLVDELRRTRENLTRSEREKIELSSEISDIGFKFDTKATKLESTEKLVMDLEEALQKRTEDYRKLELHIQDTNRKLDQGSSHLDKLNEDNREKQNSIKKLKETLSELKDHCSKQEQAKSRAEKELSELRRTINEKEAKVDQLSKTTVEVETNYLRQINSLKEEKIALDIDREQLARDFSNSKSSVEDRENTISKLRDQLESSRQEFNEYRERLEDELSKLRLETDMLDDVRRDVYSMQEDNARLRANNEELEKKMQRLISESEYVHKRNSEIINQFEEDFKSLEQKYEDKSRQLLEREQQLGAMESEHSISISSWKSKLEEEKRSLVGKIQELETAINGNQQQIRAMSSVSSTTKTSIAVSSRNTSTSINSSTTVAASSQEDREQYESQIEFLNSVIVDMQKKNDELRSKVQVLEEMGDMSAEFNEATENILKSARNGLGRRAPRLFCDICDTFDLHDTEDCPRQSGQMLEDTNGHSQHNGGRVSDRSYCASCEVFGHWTRDCDDNQSF